MNMSAEMTRKDLAWVLIGTASVFGTGVTTGFFVADAKYASDVNAVMQARDRTVQDTYHQARKAHEAHLRVIDDLEGNLDELRRERTRIAIGYAREMDKKYGEPSTSGKGACSGIIDSIIRTVIGPSKPTATGTMPNDPPPP